MAFWIPLVFRIVHPARFEKPPFACVVGREFWRVRATVVDGLPNRIERQAVILRNLFRGPRRILVAGGVEFFQGCARAVDNLGPDA